uniref:flocculation protein FLO11-like isoform X1 n=2 Tax=Styela clava TaxID=7725 RepID=UPI00193AAB6A|nr:flocculation protein FLO11-like isoform X1 [Styela clava]
MNSKTMEHIGGGREPGSSNPPSPQSRILSSSSSPELTRLSRSKTMNYQLGSGPIRPVTPTSPYHQQSKSPSFIGHNISPTKYHPSGRSHGSIDNSDCSIPSTPTSRTLSNLQRSQTTRLGPGPGLYGKNMWDEDEYVDTGGQSTTPRTPTGGAAARRINQQKKMQTVKLPKNPFIDEETTDDYADMTGHMNDRTGMNELRTAHSKSVKIRSNTVTSSDDLPVPFIDGDLSRSRNYSLGSSRSGSQSSRFKRSDTSPVFQTQGSIKEKFIDVQRNGSMKSTHPSIEEVDGTPQVHSTSMSPPKSSTANSSIAFMERQNSEARSISGNSLASTMKSQLLVPSPAHSSVSAETSNSYIPPSTNPNSPTVVYKKKDNDTLDAQVAIVVEETVPTSPMYATFAKNLNDKTQNGATLHDSRELKFEPAKSKSKWRIIVPIVLVVLLIIGLAVAVALLTSIISSQNDEVERLKKEIFALQNKQERTTNVASTFDTEPSMTFNHNTSVSAGRQQTETMLQSTTRTSISMPKLNSSTTLIPLLLEPTTSNFLEGSASNVTAT